MASLQEAGKWLTPKVDKIVSLWLQQARVQEIFNRYKISEGKFSQKFAKPILLYNIGVFEGTKEIDNCPIMNKFVDLMVKKHIHSKDIFVMCSSLRSTVVDSFLYEYADIANNMEIVSKIIYVFDRNLAGVLKNFDAKNIGEIEKTQENITLRTYVTRLQKILDTQTNIIFKLREQTLFIANQALLDATGMVNLNSFKHRFGHPLEFIDRVQTYETLFQEKNYQQWIEKIVNEHNGDCKISMFHRLMNKNVVMMMKVVKMGEGNDYVFTLQILQESEDSFDTTNYKDSLTNLASLTKFQFLVEEYLAVTKDENFNLFMIQLDGFKIFNEIKGTQKGESLIKEVASKLEEFFPKKVARVEQDRFAVIENDLNKEDAMQLIEKINLIIQEEAEDIETIAAIVVRQKGETLELMLARADDMLNTLEVDPLKTIIDDTYLAEKEKLRQKEEKIFLKEMAKLKQQKYKLPISSYYLEIPIKSDADFIHIDNDSMSVRVRKISIAALKNGEPVYIEMSEGNNVKAFVKEKNPQAGTLILHKFEYVETSPLDRKNVHVEVDKELMINISSTLHSFDGKLESVSIETFKIFCEHIYDLKENTLLTIHAKFDRNEGEYSGRVLNIITLKRGFKIIVRLSNNYSVEHQLRPYISARQINIIKELHGKVF